MPFEPTPARPMPAPLRAAECGINAHAERQRSALCRRLVDWQPSRFSSRETWLLLRRHQGAPLTVSEMTERMMQGGRQATGRAPGTTLRRVRAGSERPFAASEPREEQVTR
ncbi:MAG: hypothetical protein IPO15_24160 [Anaerolineae bacterium]|uniref:hypothetical protein n=1 Tax=Candidatus Amarolinea dominans TaxID=3140696 RepID=UPI003134CC7C|nr:hypothetical protein [Anaerolineae bacterium]